MKPIISSSFSSLSLTEDQNQQREDDRETQSTIHSTFNIQNGEFNHPLIQSYKQQLKEDGFTILSQFFDNETVAVLNERLEYILRGHFNTGIRPDKTPRRIRAHLPPSIIQNPTDEEKKEVEEEQGEKKSKHNPLNLNNSENSNYKKKSHHKRTHHIGPLGFSGNLENVKVMQVINVHKSDSYFRKVVTNPVLGKVITEITGWDGVRLAQDQIWAKPPGAPPLVFHRDSPYFMFDPPHVVTVWLALDDMETELGPLIYVKQSHKWGEGRVGTSQDFFQHDGGTDLLYSAAQRQGVSPEHLEFVSMAGLKAGGISIHDGRTWHGSSKNESNTKPRRGLGIHFVPSNVKWTNEACKSTLWKKYVQGINEDELDQKDLPEEDFPIVWERNSNSAINT